MSSEIVFDGRGQLFYQASFKNDWIFLCDNPYDSSTTLLLEIPLDATRLKIVYNDGDKEVPLGPIWHQKVIMASEPICTADAFKPNGFIKYDSSDAIVTRPFIFTDEIVDKIKRGIFYGRKK